MLAEVLPYVIAVASVLGFGVSVWSIRDTLRKRNQSP